MAENTINPPCCECNGTSILICVTCTRHFCCHHFTEHRLMYERYLDDVNQPLSTCLDVFRPIKDKLHLDINHWKDETIAEVNRSATKAREALGDHINTYLTHFNERTLNFRDILPTTNRDSVLNGLEKLQIEYAQSLKNLYLVKFHNGGLMLDIETRTGTREQVDINGSSQLAPQESDVYVAQTALGDRLNKEPLARETVGSYWAMGGSDQHLLLQEYEEKQLTLFDRQGRRGVSVTWHYDLVVRDIVWYEEHKRFFLLLDKQLISFDPITQHFQEITQVKPCQLKTYRRCTCYNDLLFIVYWGQESLIELKRISTWETVQLWLSPVTCRTNELIGSIRFNSNNQLGLTIQNETNPHCRKFRFEIRDTALNILHTVPLCVDSGIFSRLIVLPDSHWALLNVDETYVFVINQRGELIDRIQWSRSPLSNIALIGNDTIVIRTIDKIYFYDVNFHQRT